MKLTFSTIIIVLASYVTTSNAACSHACGQGFAEAGNAAKAIDRIMGFLGCNVGTRFVRFPGGTLEARQPGTNAYARLVTPKPEPGGYIVVECDVVQQQWLFLQQNCLARYGDGVGTVHVGFDQHVKLSVCPATWIRDVDEAESEEFEVRSIDEALE